MGLLTHFATTGSEYLLWEVPPAWGLPPLNSCRTPAPKSS